MNVGGTYDGVISLGDDISLTVETLMPNPQITLNSPSLLFEKFDDNNLFVASPPNPGQYHGTISVNTEGWEPWDLSFQTEVAYLIEFGFETITDGGTSLQTSLNVGDRQVLSGFNTEITPGPYTMDFEEVIEVNGVTYTLEKATVESLLTGQTDTKLNPDNTIITIAEPSVITAHYQSSINVKATAYINNDPIDLSGSGLYALDDVVTIYADPELQYFGLLKEVPVSWEGLPAGADIAGDNTAAQFVANSNVNISVYYERDITLLIVVGAGIVTIPVGILLYRTKLSKMSVFGGQ